MPDRVFIHRDSGINIAAERVAGQMAAQRAGLNPDVGMSVETVWDLGGLYAYPPAAITMTISSGDGVDTAAGDGARTVIIEGLNEDWAHVSTTAILDGQNAVTLDIAFRRIYTAMVLTAGDGGQNAGIIYIGSGVVASGVPASKYAGILIGKNQTSMAMYTIPKDCTGYVYRGYMGAGKSQDATGEFFVRIPGGVFARKQAQQVYQNFLNFVPTYPLKIPAMSDIEMRAVSSAGGVAVSAGFDMLIEDD